LLYQLSYTGTGYIRGIAFYVLEAASAMFLDRNLSLYHFQLWDRFPVLLHHQPNHFPDKALNAA
jgi:hypothetical protein